MEKFALIRYDASEILVCILSSVHILETHSSKEQQKTQIVDIEALCN